MGKEAELIEQVKKLSLELYETFNQLHEEKEKQSLKYSTSTTKNYIPTETTIRIDTYVRDQIKALSLIGFGSTQKETVELIVQNMLGSMTKDELKKFNAQYQVLEDKTIQQVKKSEVN